MEVAVGLTYKTQLSSFYKTKVVFLAKKSISNFLKSCISKYISNFLGTLGKKREQKPFIFYVVLV